MSRARVRVALLLLAVVAWHSPAHAKGAPITISVDASEAPTKMFHARLVFPVEAGPLTLYYPKWIPGEHGPTGTITDLAGLHFTALGKPVSWRRDSVDMFAFHVNVPKGATTLEVALDYLSPANMGNFSAGPSATENLMVLNWNQLLLYPAAAGSSDAYTYTAHLKLPPNWAFGTALPVSKQNGQTIDFQPVTLTTLVDSPVVAGVNFRRISLTPGATPAHYIDMVADSKADLEMSPDQIAAYQRLVAETGALFGARHYREYHFLYTLSDQVAHFGLEHHESSDDRVPERALLDKEMRLRTAGLLPHEMVHSWNGKYRRPYDLATADYNHEPMKGDLLWVYEGLTQYLGFILTARSGLAGQGPWRENLADIAAYLDQRPGRTWRPLIDTAIAAQLLYNASPEWQSWRRGTDFYNESLLIWLEADALIRQRTHGQKSIDDFCHAFHGGQSGVPAVVPYTFDDVVNTLERVTPYDWRGFLTQRLESTAPHAPLGGVTNSGWKVVYRDSMNNYEKDMETAYKNIDERFSIGMVLDQNGYIEDVIQGQPAAKTGIGPGMKVIAVNGRQWTKDVFREGIKGTKTDKAPLELLVENGTRYRTFALNYHDGLRYPDLERDATKPDLLSEILRPKAQQTAVVKAR